MHFDVQDFGLFVITHCCDLEWLVLMNQNEANHTADKSLLSAQSFITWSCIFSWFLRWFYIFYYWFFTGFSKQTGILYWKCEFHVPDGTLFDVCHDPLERAKQSLLLKHEGPQNCPLFLPLQWFCCSDICASNPLARKDHKFNKNGCNYESYQMGTAPGIMPSFAMTH